jgi:predicted lipoprotein with Yx(FWY)xxD motif
MGIMSILLAAAAGLQAPIPEVPPAVQVIAQEGQYVLRTLADDRSLYTFDRDEPGKSNCTGQCIAAWPALVAPADARPVGKWTIVKREDGSSQWAFGGKPVYTFAHDPEGVASGDGMGGVWHQLPSTRAR